MGSPSAGSRESEPRTTTAARPTSAARPTEPVLRADLVDDVGSRRSTWRQVVTPHHFPLGLADPRVTGLYQPEVAVSKTGSGFKAAAIIPGPLNSAWSKRLGKMSDNVT